MKRRFRMAWKDPGYCCGEFLKLPIQKATILTEWEAVRAMMPDRAYKCKVKDRGLKIDHFSRPFDYPNKELLGENFSKYLTKFEKHF